MNSSQKTLLLAIGAIIIGGFGAIFIRFMGPFLSSLIGNVPVFGAYIFAILFVLIVIAIAVVIKKNSRRAIIILIGVIAAIVGCVWCENDTRGYKPCGDGYFVDHYYNSSGCHNRYLNRFGKRVSEFDD